MAKKLTAKKAKIMLKEGNFDSEKQRKYFGYIAGGGKAEDGMNLTGYLDGAPTAENPYNIIPGQNGMTPITTDGMAFPIYANGQYLQPNTGDYLFPGNSVFETKAQSGAEVPYANNNMTPWWLQQAYTQSQQVQPLETNTTPYVQVDQTPPQGQPIQNMPQQSPTQSSPNYGGWIQQGAQAIGGVLDTIGDVKKGILKGGASILNALIPDNQPRRDYQPQVAYNRDPYGQDQYNNMYKFGGVIAQNGAVVTNYGYNDPIPNLTQAQIAALQTHIPYPKPNQQSTYNPPQPYTSTGDQRDLFTKAYRNSAGQAQSGTNYSGHMWGDYSKIAPPLPGQNDPYGQSYIQDPQGGFMMNTNLAPLRYSQAGEPYRMENGGSLDKDGYQEVELTRKQIEEYRKMGYDIQF